MTRARVRGKARLAVGLAVGLAAAVLCVPARPAAANPNEGEGRSIVRDADRVYTVVAGEADGASTVTNPANLGLLRGIVELSAEMQLSAWCAIMERSLLRLLRLSGVHFHSLGPLIEHHGLRQPTWGRIDDVLGRMRRDCPMVWNYITDGGSLWPCASEPMSAAVA